MFAQFKRRAGACVVGVAIVAGALPAAAAELVTYGSLPDPGYDAVVRAIENGKVTDPNVTLKVERLSSIPALMQAAMTAQFNLIPNGVLAIPQMRESGIPVKVVSTLLRYNPDGHSADIWVTKDSPYKTIRDLKGKTIAVVSGEAQNVISDRWVIGERFGMNSDIVGGDFKWVEMPHAQFEAALQSGRVDAAAFSNVASYTLTKDGTYRSCCMVRRSWKMYGGPMPRCLSSIRDRSQQAAGRYKAAGNLPRRQPNMCSRTRTKFRGGGAQVQDDQDDVQTWFTTFAQMPLDRADDQRSAKA
jgi:NitT/TauT family transport system substrate-binding protein